MSNIHSLEAIQAVKDLNDKIAATCSGGSKEIGIPISPDVTLFDDAAFQGKSRKISRSTPQLGCFDNLTSSIKIHRGTWELYSEPNYQGEKITLKSGSFFMLPESWNDKLSSLKRIDTGIVPK